MYVCTRVRMYTLHVLFIPTTSSGLCPSSPSPPSPLPVSDFPSGGRDAAQVMAGGHGHPQAYLPEDLDPQATRSLFVGNIPKNINVYELRDTFQRYGNVLVSLNSYVTVYHTACVSCSAWQLHVHVCSVVNSRGAVCVYCQGVGKWQNYRPNLVAGKLQFRQG